MPGVLHTRRAAIAVLEREPYWAPELQRQLGDDGVYIRACVNSDDVDRVFAEWPRSLAVIDLDAAPAAILGWLGKQTGRASRPVLLFASTAMAELEPIARELGATSFQTDVISGRELAIRCRRWLS
jgi:hypothetical protein